MLVAFSPPRQEWMKDWINLPHFAGDGMPTVNNEGEQLTWDSPNEDYAGHPPSAGSHAKILRVAWEAKGSVDARPFPIELLVDQASPGNIFVNPVCVYSAAGVEHRISKEVVRRLPSADRSIGLQLCRLLNICRLQRRSPGELYFNYVSWKLVRRLEAGAARITAHLATPQENPTSSERLLHQGRPNEYPNYKRHRRNAQKINRI